MSTKSTIFLTDDNEHCYIEHIDNTIVLEMNKASFQILMDDSDCLVIEFKENSQIAKEFEKLHAQQYEISSLKRKV
ncbi:MAG: hypothetical protein IID16_00975 [Candidatus Marinimicrobia bacterium]|nr:hypothetical protein [Candidatus Neomarinimicrobiota bacterium]